MSADNAFQFAAFFVATVSCASFVGCVVDRTLVSWRTGKIGEGQLSD